MFVKPLSALCLVLTLVAAPLAEDQVVDVSSEDAAMNAAIDKARQSLPVFWEHFAAPAANEADFALKLGISDANGTEHFWCGDIEGDANMATCVIGNEPVHVFAVDYGERVDVDPAIISDWMYYRDDKIVGGETIRAILPHLDKKAAADLRAQLAEP